MIGTGVPSAYPLPRHAPRAPCYTGGPEMVVNQCTQETDGKFVVDTIWFGVGQAEERGTYQEGLLEAHEVPLYKRKG